MYLLIYNSTFDKYFRLLSYDIISPNLHFSISQFSISSSPPSYIKVPVKNFYPLWSR